MSLILKLPGSRAVSPFRLEKLNSRLASANSSVRAAGAEYWHFAETVRTLNARESEVLERLLEYGDPSPAGRGSMLLVVPRPGTISPWSSKATDIARQCGLDVVRWVERGTAWLFQPGRDFDQDRAAIL